MGRVFGKQIFFLANKLIVKSKPWTIGLYESIAVVDLIFKQRLAEKNRSCLILLDSSIEIAFKEYLVNDSGEYYSNERIKELFGKRHLVHKEVKKFVEFKDGTWKKINFYYNLRCKLIHERATSGIIDGQIEIFREVVEKKVIALAKVIGKIKSQEKTGQAEQD